MQFLPHVVAFSRKPQLQSYSYYCKPVKSSCAFFSNNWRYLLPSQQLCWEFVHVRQVFASMSYENKRCSIEYLAKMNGFHFFHGHRLVKIRLLHSGLLFLLFFAWYFYKTSGYFSIFSIISEKLVKTSTLKLECSYIFASIFVFGALHLSTSSAWMPSFFEISRCYLNIPIFNGGESLVQKRDLQKRCTQQLFFCSNQNFPMASLKYLQWVKLFIQKVKLKKSRLKNWSDGMGQKITATPWGNSELSAFFSKWPTNANEFHVGMAWFLGGFISIFSLSNAAAAAV